MIAARLVRLIEEHSEELASSLMQRLAASPHAAELRKIPYDEMRQRVYEIYRNLSNWLLTATEGDIEKRYTAVGMRRAAQDVALSAVIYALLVSKEHLWEFLRYQGLADRHIELFQEIELLQMVDRFYDRAVFYLARGYEKALTPHAA